MEDEERRWQRSGVVEGMERQGGRGGGGGEWCDVKGNESREERR